jgi:hypothetical protein
VTPERLRPGQKVMHPGPMNRGVEIDPRVADHADALIETQVRAGLVTRMAVLYDLLTSGPGRRQDRVGAGGGVMLSPSPHDGEPRRARRSGRRSGRGRGRGARRARDDGVIAGSGPTSTRTRTAYSRAKGLVLAPAFVDPHVHCARRARDERRSRAERPPLRRRLLRDPRMPNTEPS